MNQPYDETGAAPEENSDYGDSRPSDSSTPPQASSSPGTHTIAAPLLPAGSESSGSPLDLESYLSLLTATLESTSDGIVVLDLAGNLVFYNQKFSSIWQFPDGPLNRRDSRELMAHAAQQVVDPPAFLQLIGRRQSEAHSEALDIIQFKDGRILERCSFPQLVNGHCIGVVVSFRDVTYKKNAEADLLVSEEKYRLLWATAEDALLLIGSDNIILESNPAMASIFGYEPAELEGQNISVLQPERLREGHRRGLQKYLDSGQRTLDWRSTEAIGLHRDGHEFPIEIVFNHVRVEGKDLFACLIRDITTRKQAEQASAVFAAIVDSSNDAIVSKTMDSIITSWNRGAERIFGYSAGEAIGKSIMLIIPPERADEEPQIIARQARGEGVDHFETVRIRKDGQRIEVSVTLSPIKDAHGRIVGISKIARDITERKLAEVEREMLLQREQQAREEAETANRTKDEFLATLSHELRTPLTAIIGWSALVADNDLEEEERSRALEAIRRNANLQNQLIGDILDVSRIITGKLRLDVQTVELAAVIEAAVESVLPAAEAKGIRLQRVLDSDTNLVAGDPNRLQQVIWNLLTNAVKFTPKGGKVQVRLERINSHVEIIVTDSGMGIPQEVLPHVFEKFHQADQSSTRSFGGLGLGLSIVRHIVEMHGGSVQADSGGEGKGATFTVKLPLMATRTGEIKTEDSSRVHSKAGSVLGTVRAPFECPPELKDLHVLVVDDDQDARLVIKAILEKCQARVTTASSAAQAFELIQSCRPDVLVSDVGMPGEDGYQLIQKIRALKPERGGRTPAAALTAYARVEDRLQALRAGFQIHLSKPIEPIELVTVVSNLASHSRN